MPKPESFGVLFGRLVREKRGVEGLSQDGLSVQTELTKARISDLETGKIDNPHASTIDALCVALNISRQERMECYAPGEGNLPPRLLENLALRFGYDNPQACEADLEAFLRNKAEEFRQMKARLARIMEIEGEVAGLVAAASDALQDADFDLADARLGEAERVHLNATTMVALERQWELRLARGQASLLAGDVAMATTHWEAGAGYFRPFDRNTEAEKRYGFSNELRAYGYRYASVPALEAAATALRTNLEIWGQARSPQGWCRVMVALGGTCLRLAQFDHSERYPVHISTARAAYEAVRSASSEAVLPYYYAISGGNLANVLSERKVAKSDVEYVWNLKRGLELRLSGLSALDPAQWPEEWGIFQHNVGLSYIQLFKESQNDNFERNLIDSAIDHLTQSFQVRDVEVDLQYWIASSRSLGEALIEKSRSQTGAEASASLGQAEAIIRNALTKIVEGDHPHQWAELHDQLVRCIRP